MIRFLSLIVFLLIAACSTTTEQGEVGVNRKQFFAVSEEEVVAGSAKAYEETKAEAKKKGTLDRDAQMVARVNNIAQKLIPQSSVFRKDATKWAWETHVITSKDLNAYCMPGGKIIFYSGIIETLQLTDAEIAAIMGHEIAHALREHGRERMSEEMGKNLATNILVMTGVMDPKYAEALSTAANLAVSLPHSRRHETEADDIGVELMARAGYDPQAAVSLWTKMAALGGSKPPQLLSTHPADETRIRNITALLPKVTPLYQRAQR